MIKINKSTGQVKGYKGRIPTWVHIGLKLDQGEKKILKALGVGLIYE